MPKPSVPLFCAADLTRVGSTKQSVESRGEDIEVGAGADEKQPRFVPADCGEKQPHFVPVDCGDIEISDERRRSGPTTEVVCGWADEDTIPA